MTPIADPIDVAIRVAAILDRVGIRYTIGGSVAASIAGEPRSTLDIDIVVALTRGQVDALLRELGSAFYASPEAIHRAIDTLGTVNVIDQETNVKVDLFVAGGTPLDLQQLERRQAVEIRGGSVIYVHPPEDILLQKLRWHRKGGGTSDRQWRDILGIIRTQGANLDRRYLVANAPALDIEADLARALRDADGEP